MLQDVESLTNSEMSSITDNMIKVGYAVISADWRSADRSYFSDSVHTCCTMICLSNCVVARVINKHHKHP